MFGSLSFDISLRNRTYHEFVCSVVKIHEKWTVFFCTVNWFSFFLSRKYLFYFCPLNTVHHRNVRFINFWIVGILYRKLVQFDLSGDRPLIHYSHKNAQVFFYSQLSLRGKRDPLRTINLFGFFSLVT